MGKAVLQAPLYGIAAGVAGAFLSLSRRKASGKGGEKDNE